MRASAARSDQTPSVVRALLITFSVAVLVVAGYRSGTASGEQPYGTDDVLRAFRSSGIDLNSERLNDDDRTCTSPTSVPAVSADGVECSSVVIASGEEPTAPFPQMLQRVTLWNERERRNWVIWLFDNEDQARDLVTKPPPSPLGQPLKVARAGNVVVMYLDGTDGPRLFGALAQLSEG
jgi:hypothetical protein